MSELQKILLINLIFVALYAFNQVLIHTILYH